MLLYFDCIFSGTCTYYSPILRIYIYISACINMQVEFSVTGLSGKIDETVCSPAEYVRDFKMDLAVIFSEAHLQGFRTFGLEEAVLGFQQVLGFTQEQLREQKNLWVATRRTEVWFIV
jgi:hypothetical protein